jgi:hypothetical protein
VNSSGGVSGFYALFFNFGHYVSLANQVKPGDIKTADNCHQIRYWDNFWQEYGKRGLAFDSG